MMDNSLLIELAVLGAVFASIVLVVFGVGMAMTKGKVHRLDDDRADTNSRKPFVDSGVVSATLKAMKPLQRRLTQSDPKQVGEIKKSLIEAGVYNRRAVDIFFSAKLALAICLAMASGILIFLFPALLKGMTALAVIFGASALGYYLPSLWLRSRISARRKAFTHGLPDALDTILMGVQAGLSLSAAIRHVVKELGEAHPVVAEQFQTVALEFQAGVGHGEALNRMAERMRVPDARTFASMVGQAETLGASLSETLQVIAEQMRSERMLRAEKTAAELPVKMAIPLVLMIFPVVMVVILTPVIIRFVEIMGELTQ